MDKNDPGNKPEKKKAHIYHNLLYMTQIGLSMSIPPILSMLAAGWLQQRFQLIVCEHVNVGSGSRSPCHSGACVAYLADFKGELNPPLGMGVGKRVAGIGKKSAVYSI